MKYIEIKGARVHNLKSVCLKIPKNRFIIITGVSGSGKSSLAFDTIYAEGQRRYVESLSSYARQFLGIMDKPDVDSIEGLSPSIAIEQRSISKNPRSIVATTTEIYDYLRVLFARTGDIFCYNCNRPIKSVTIDEIVNDILKLPLNTRIDILSPVIINKKGTFKEFLKKLIKRGYTRVMIDNNQFLLDDNIKIDKYKKHNIEIIVDRLKIQSNVKIRLYQSIEVALRESNGIVYVLINSKEKRIYNESMTCNYCMISYKEITPASFSFNSPYGACEKCHGLGVEMDIDEDSVITDASLSISEGAIEPWGDIYRRKGLIQFAKKNNIDLQKPWKQLSKEKKNLLLHGDKDENIFEGVLPYLKRLYINSDSNWLKYEIEKYMSFQKCSHCNGARLNREALSVKIHNHSIADIIEMNIDKACEFFEKLKFKGEKAIIAKELIKEILKRLQFLCRVGLNYLTLNRRIDTLSGGEEQRVRLATQIGSGLTGVLYVLDEPSIGLHQKDIQKLIDSLIGLRNMDNTVIVVEHDESFIKQSDFIVDLGPYAGTKGGEIVYAGDLNGLLNNKQSLTGRFFTKKENVHIKRHRKVSLNKYIEIIGAREHNLKNINVKIPLNVLVGITGVSGSGKSTLINDILYNAFRKHLYTSHIKPGKHKAIKNMHLIDSVINISQTPIGRTPRSNPATYTGVYTLIRELFAELRESRKRGFKVGRFSFNVKGGRCEACEGTGFKKIEMHFLPDIYVKCEICKGHRFNSETLQIKYKNANISDILNMSVDEAYKHFKSKNRIIKKLELLRSVGLGYIKLGQSATSLSGGEAQRIKLAKELSKKDTGNTLYILDEPTTGLHAYDIKMLLNVLDILVNKGNTLIVIEHNLDVIRSCDWIIDLGPDGGDNGGNIVAQGSVDDIISNNNSYTGKYLKEYIYGKSQKYC